MLADDFVSCTIAWSPNRKVLNHMKKIFCLAALCCMFLTSAVAQDGDVPAGEFFGGYSYFNAEGVPDRDNFHGWNASVAFNLHQNWSLVFDVSGQYGDPIGVDLNQHSFLAGPRYSFRNHERVTPFLHALGGFMNEKVTFAGVDDSNSAFAMALGGGVDVDITDRVAWRAIQAEYFLTTFNDHSQDNVRVGTGVVFHWGSR
jgi:opacity protein-like surface antigen